MGEAPALIVIWGAVLVSRLVAPATVTTIGKSPVATVEGKVKVTTSVPGRSVLELVLALIDVVPTVTLTLAAREFRTPVKETRKTVATWLPLPSFVVTPNGSGE